MSKTRKLTIKQKKFVDKVLETGNATEAALEAYNTTTNWSARAIWSENLTKPNIEAEIEDRMRVAKDMIYTIATTSEKDETKLRACQDIVDRWEGKPTQKILHKEDEDQHKERVDLAKASMKELEEHRQNLIRV